MSQSPRGSDSRPLPLDYFETAAILGGPSQIPRPEAQRIHGLAQEGEPLVHNASFAHRLGVLLFAGPRASETPGVDYAATYNAILGLASCSSEMALLQSGSSGTRREQRLYQHNQSVSAIFDRYFADRFAEQRDRFLRGSFWFQDVGKSLAVALADPKDKRPSRHQAKYNKLLTDNLLAHLPDDVLSPEEKQLIQLLHSVDLGRPLYHHQEEGDDLEQVVGQLQDEVARVRAACPLPYRDRVDDYLLTTYCADAGAHTQRARYVDAGTNQLIDDVKWSDRFDEHGQDRKQTLDYIFSQAPEDAGLLKLYLPGHLAVLGAVFPNHYQAYVRLPE